MAEATLWYESAETQSFKARIKSAKTRGETTALYNDILSWYEKEKKGAILAYGVKSDEVKLLDRTEASLLLALQAKEQELKLTPSTAPKKFPWGAVGIIGVLLVGGYFLFVRD